jgi:hypothetical protein
MQSATATIPAPLNDGLVLKILSAARYIHAELLRRYESRGGAPDDEYLDLWLRDKLHAEIEKPLWSEASTPWSPDTALRTSILLYAGKLLEAADMIRQGHSERALEHLSAEFESFHELEELASYALPILVEIVARMLPLADSAFEEESTGNIACLGMVGLIVHEFLEDGAEEYVPELLLPALIVMAVQAQRL